MKKQKLGVNAKKIQIFGENEGTYKKITLKIMKSKRHGAYIQSQLHPLKVEKGRKICWDEFMRTLVY